MDLHLPLGLGQGLFSMLPLFIWLFQLAVLIALILLGLALSHGLNYVKKEQYATL
jgi:hypothetical protein